MSGEEISVRHRLVESVGLTIDWRTAVLVGFVLLVQGGAIVALEVVGELPTVPETQSAQPEIGIGYVAILVAETFALIGLYRLYKRLPEWVRVLVKKGLKGLFLLLGVCLWAVTGYFAYLDGILPAYFVGVAGTAGCIGLVLLFFKFDLYWLLFNLIGTGLGIAGTAILGSFLAPAAVLPLLVLLIVWDHVAVNLSEWMNEIVELSSSIGFPNFLVIPNRPTIDFSEVVSFIQGEEDVERPDGLEFVIGVGDFVIPGLLTVSAWVAGFSLPAIGALLGTCVAAVVLLDSLEGADGGLPGLPWLNTGAMVGFGAGILVSGAPVMAVIA